MAAGAVIRAFGSTLTTVDLALQLSGPEPWYAQGRASFRVIFRYHVSFDLSVGAAPQAVPAAPVDVRAMLIEALQRPSSWSGALPPRDSTSVALRDLGLDAGADLLIHPQARFGVQQTVLPLGLQIARYGNRSLKDDGRFVILRVRIGGAEAQQESVVALFAPAQYLEMTAAEKLVAPAYQAFDAGLTVLPRGASGGEQIQVQPQYEDVIIDRGDRTASDQRSSLPPGAMAQAHQRSAVSSSLRMKRNGVAFAGAQQRIRLRAVA